MNVYLIRHAQPKSGPLADADPMLTPFGAAQANKLGDMLVRLIPAGEPAKILASRLRRATHTASIIRTKLNMSDAVIGFPAPTTEADAVQVERLMTQLRLAVSPPALPARHLIVIWHYPLIREALQWLVGSGQLRVRDVLEWPDIYGAIACVNCDNATFQQRTGKLSSFLWADMLP